MRLQINILRSLTFGRARKDAGRARRAQKAALLCETLEGRVTPAHFHGVHHALAAVYGHHHSGHSESTSSTTTAASATSTTGATAKSTAATTATEDQSSSTEAEQKNSSESSSSSSSTLSSAQKTLKNDIQTIQLASNTTIGELTAIRVAMQTLSNDGLSPSSTKALQSFEDSLVTAKASGTNLATDSTLLSQFEVLYTSSPTTQQTTDLTTAYNALAAAVTSAGITSADISTINTDWAAVQVAQGITTTTSFPYFTLVTGHAYDGPGGDGGCEEMDS